MTTAIAKPADRTERGERTERRRSRTRHSAQRPHAEAGVARREGSSRADDGPTPSTLAESLERAWEDLASRGRAECLVCGGDLTATDSSPAPPVAAACRDCGSSLA
jgi:hypothetical protein